MFWLKEKNENETSACCFVLNILLTSVEDVVIIYWNEVYVAVIQSRYLLDVQAASVVMFTQASISQCTTVVQYSTRTVLGRFV